MNGQSAQVVIFDDECPMCTFQTRLLTWLDWRDVVRLRPLSDPDSVLLAPGLRQEDLRAALHCITPDGKIHRGARAIRHLSMRIPALLPLGVVLWVPGVIWFAERIYMWISRHRQLLSRLFGCKEACSVLPVRKSRVDCEHPKAGDV